jgi:hypothetical protein
MWRGPVASERCAKHLEQALSLTILSNGWTIVLQTEAVVV